jgi:hypothetical protein
MVKTIIIADGNISPFNTRALYGKENVVAFLALLGIDRFEEFDRLPHVSLLTPLQ